MFLIKLKIILQLTRKLTSLFHGDEYDTMRQSSQLGGNTIQFHRQVQLRGLLTFFSQESVVVNEYLYQLDSYFQQSNYSLVLYCKRKDSKKMISDNDMYLLICTHCNYSPESLRTLSAVAQVLKLERSNN